MFDELYRYLLFRSNDIVIVSENHNRLKRRALIYINIDMSVKHKYETRVFGCIILSVYKKKFP